MTVAFKQLYQAAPTAGTIVSAYTVPALTTALLGKLAVNNPQATAGSFDIWLTASGTETNANHFLGPIIVAPGETWSDNLGQVLPASAVVRLRSTGVALSYHLPGVEQS